MPVPSMNHSAWDNNTAGVLQNPREMAGIRQNTGARSQDDAMVGYFFQRPQTDELTGYTNKRWAVGDDSVIEQTPRGMTVQDLERDFHALSMNREVNNPSKKIWDDDPNKGGDASKAGLFQPHHWTTRDDGWSGGPPQGKLPGAPHMMAMQKYQDSAVGIDMVEYVLGRSPNTGKEMDARLNRMKPGAYNVPPVGDGGDAGGEKKSQTSSPFDGEGDRIEDNKDGLQTNGILQNGLEDTSGFRGSRQNSPTGDEGKYQDIPKLPMKPEGDFFESQSFHPQSGGNFQFDSQQFEPMGIDPVQFDYTNQMMQSMDSPNFNNMDYNQQLQRQQQPIAVLTQQQYALATQQQLGLNPSSVGTNAQYLIGTQDPYAVGIPLAGPTVIHPQYYGVQAPWGIYPANLIQQAPQGQQTPQGMSQQQQQQLLRGQGNRPLTPSQQSDGMGTPNSLQPQSLPSNGAYQILTPAYYDQNGQLVMGNPRGMGTPVRLVSPAPVLVGGGGNQQGGNNPLRLLTTQTQQVPTPPVVLSSNSSTSQNNSMGYTPSTSVGYTQVTPSLYTPISTNLTLNHQANNYNNTGLDAITSSNTGIIGQRRESFDVKRQLGGYYGSLSGMAGSPVGHGGLLQPGQSMTPPPSLSGSSSNLTLGFGAARPYSAAPGAEAKYRAGLMSPANGLFGNSSLFQNRNMASRSASLSKEVTGRSRLLEDFRNNRIPNLQLKDLANHVVEFSQDQHGSRFIQQKLERASTQEKSMVFAEILTAAYSLMTDVFGNYVIQKFFEFGSPEQKNTLAQRVRGHVLPLALQMYGCRVIQKALESIPAEMQVEILKVLDGHR
ncbi:pumilio homolog 1 [Patella vulgata]|uniref:pumilio homolog 1 n=1 Tax=Patella vulgata TaxID=6465 RepID=UPI0024A8DEC5|nr:pumilio homolog 1 [Patella vulgata]